MVPQWDPVWERSSKNGLLRMMGRDRLEKREHRTNPWGEEKCTEREGMSVARTVTLVRSLMCSREAEERK